ncbi:MAG: MFS transporter [Phycisphaeraceae bacterium]
MTTIDTATEPSADRVARWGLFFALAYAVQGYAQTTGVLMQPINYFYKVEHGYTASQLAGVSFWMTFPWYIKPVYGLLADFIPLFGYRRRSYLIVSCVVAAAAFLLLLKITDPVVLVYALTLTALCTAIGDVMVDALMVEHGQRLNKIKRFQGIQWSVLSVLGVFAALAGGWFAEYAKEIGEPHRAIEFGALVAMTGPIVLLISTLWIVREPRSRLDAEGVAATAKGFRAALTSKPLLGVLVFICMFWFQPGLAATMYLHATETLEISEAFYGTADAWAKAGYVLGALAFMLVLGPRLSTRQLAILSILVYAAVTFGYLGLVGKKTLVVLSFAYGVCYMVSVLTLMSLAAEVCPRRVEGFVFAFLMGVMNFVRMGSDWIGGRIYDELVPVYNGTATEGLWTVLSGMKHPVDPLIVISGVITLLAFVFVPLLPKRDKQETAPAEPV